MDAIGLVVEGVALRGHGLLDLVIAHLHIVDVGQPRLVGGHGGDKLTVPVDLKAGTGQIIVVVGVLLGENEGQLAGVRKGQGHVPLAVPVHGLGRAVQVVALRGSHLIDLIATQGELVDVELNIPRMIGDLGGLVGAVDLLEAEGSAPQGVVGLNILLVDGEGAERVILDSLKGGVRRNDLHVSRLNHSITRRSFGLRQGEDFLGIQIVPKNFAIGIGGAGEVCTAGAGQGKLSPSQWFAASAHLLYHEASDLCDVAAPGQHSVCRQRAPRGISQDITLLGVVLVIGKEDFILHDIGRAVDGDLAAGGGGVHGDAQLGLAPVFVAIVVDLGADAKVRLGG